MVLEARLTRKYLIVVLVFIIASCAANDWKVTDHVEFQGYDLTLKMSQDSCFLDSKAGNTLESSTLNIKPPCYFLRREDKNLQFFSYEDVEVLSAIIVVGSLVSEEKRRKWAIAEGTVCGESRQGVLIKKSGIVITEKTLDGGVVCKDKGADEKDFWYFAH